jgi:DNA-binding NarL/FixJ family response regulator
MRAALRNFLVLSFPTLEVIEAADGAAAMTLFAERRPMLVLMDVHLPDGNGVELTRRIKALAPETVVVVMSIQNNAHTVEQSLAAGAAAFVSKDRVFSELAPLIKKLSPLTGGPL